MNRLLDVSRETFKENVGDVLQLANQMTEELGFTVISTFKESGFIFSVKKSEADSGLPKVCINVTAKGETWVFSTVELVHIMA
jgi:DNA mismatch repair protein MSH4